MTHRQATAYKLTSNSSAEHLLL